jgi:hypothetical protein
MLTVKFNILNKEWKLKLLKNKKHKKKNGDDNVAITKYWKREISISIGGADLETIVHELVHAYRAEMCTGSMTEMSADDMEENCCEVFAKRGRELLDLADILFTQVEAKIKANIIYVQEK